MSTLVSLALTFALPLMNVYRCYRREPAMSETGPRCVSGEAPKWGNTKPDWQTAFHFATAGPVTTRSYFVNVNLLSRMSLVAISQLSAS